MFLRFWPSFCFFASVFVIVWALTSATSCQDADFFPGVILTNIKFSNLPFKTHMLYFEICVRIAELNLWAHCYCIVFLSWFKSLNCGLIEGLRTIDTRLLRRISNAFCQVRAGIPLRDVFQWVNVLCLSIICYIAWFSLIRCATTFLCYSWCPVARSTHTSNNRWWGKDYVTPCMSRIMGHPVC